MPYSHRAMYTRMRSWPAVDCAPKPVRDAYAAHQQAADAADQAQRDRNQKQEAFQNADRDDHRAAVEATRDKRPIPAPTKEAKREQAEQAQRGYDACCAVAVEAENALIAVATEHRQEWLEALRPSLEKAVTDAAKVVRKAEEAITEVYGMAAAYRWLEQARTLTASPSDRIPQDVQHAILTSRAVLEQSTPAAIQQTIDARRAEEEALAEEVRNSIGGVVVRKRRSFAT